MKIDYLFKPQRKKNNGKLENCVKASAGKQKMIQKCTYIFLYFNLIFSRYLS